MARTLAVNANNDLFLGADGNLALVTALEAVLQTCEHVAKAQLGEMVLATSAGIPNFQTVWVGVPNLSQFDAALLAALQSVPDVTRVTALTTSVSGGVLSYTATIQTIYGTGDING